MWNAGAERGGFASQWLGRAAEAEQAGAWLGQRPGGEKLPQLGRPPARPALAGLGRRYLPHLAPLRVTLATVRNG